MEQIARITGVMCLVIMVVSFINNLGGFACTEKVIKFVTAIIVVALFFKTVNNTQIELHFDNYNNSNISTDDEVYLKYILVEQTAHMLEETVKNRLDEKNISYNTVSVHILEQNNNLIADRIIVDCNKDCENTVKECLQDIISAETVITTGE